MSLVAFAIRICLWRALRGKTLAETRVYDSDVAPIEVLLAVEPGPVIVVSTDDDEFEIENTNWLNAPRKLDVIVETILASLVEVQGQGFEFSIPHTDSGMEASLNILGRQVLRVIQADQGIWAVLFRSFVSASPKKVKLRRGAEAIKGGTRFAARQMIVTVDPLHEPDFGRDPEGLWVDLLAAMRADDPALGLPPYADLLEAEIRGTALPDWRAFQASLGLSIEAVREIGEAPVDLTEEGEPAALETVTLDAMAGSATVASRTIEEGVQTTFDVLPEA